MTDDWGRTEAQARLTCAAGRDGELFPVVGQTVTVHYIGKVRRVRAWRRSTRQPAFGLPRAH